MIFTIGYDGKDFTPAHLAAILDQIDATLVDVRLKPAAQNKQNKGWGAKQLKAIVPESRYVSCADLGHRTVTPTALAWLTKRFYHLGAPHCVLLCKEENPGVCHRHHAICADRFPEAIHIFRDRFMSEEGLDSLLKRGEDPESYPLAELQQFVEQCENFEEIETGADRPQRRRESRPAAPGGDRLSGVAPPT